MFEWRVIRIKSSPARWDIEDHFAGAGDAQLLGLGHMIERLDINDAKEWSEMDISVESCFAVPPSLT